MSSSSLMRRSFTTLFRLTPPCSSSSSSSSWVCSLSKQKRQFSSSLLNPLLNVFSSSSSTDAEEIAISSSDDAKKLNQPSNEIQKEIERLQDWIDKTKAIDCMTPNRFPFEIIDGEHEKKGSTIMLKRVISGETIDVVVGLDENMTRYSQKEVYLVVTVRKGDGRRLEICCIFENEPSVKVTSVKIKGPEEESSTVQNVIDHDELLDLKYWFSLPREITVDVQNAFREYLETIGIEYSWRYFLLHYISNKDMREHLLWLKGIKEAIEY